MTTVVAMNLSGTLARWRELVWPREHGSWSLALEPLALGLLVAPSPPGAWLAGAVVAAFFARRPLRTAIGDAQFERRAAARVPLVVLAMIAIAIFLVACASARDFAWLVRLLPVAGAGAVFLFFDLRGGGREEAAEIAGAAAFAFVPAALATLANWSPAEATALAFVMLGRSVPTVMTVRSLLRAQKTGERRVALALVASLMAAVAGVTLARAEFAPRTAAVLLGLLAVRAVVLLEWPRPALRARTLGMFEAALGAAFVLAVALAWRM